MRRFARENSLTLVFLGLCLGALILQAVAGHAVFNNEADQHMEPHISFWRYVFSSSYAAAVMENWQSEYLQFTLFVILTVWLLQKGSPESKELGKDGLESDEDQQVGEHARPASPRWARAGGLRTRLYSHSLLITMTAIWISTWFAQAVTGRIDYNAEQLDHHKAGLSLWQ